MNIEEITKLIGGNPSWSANWSLGGCEFYGEVMDDATFGVWLSTEPISPEEYAALVAPEGFRKSGVGRSQHDAVTHLGNGAIAHDDGRWPARRAGSRGPSPGRRK